MNGLALCLAVALAAAALKWAMPAAAAAEKPWDGVVIGEADYQGLLAFRYALQDPHGFLRSWNGSGIGACSGAWAGIKCVKGKVISIQLPWRGLGGHLTEKIGQLSALRKLSLHDNSIAGQVPQSIGFLRDLRGVYLFNNRFSGALPPAIGSCPLLQALDFSNNRLSGGIPSTISKPASLYRLNFSYNELTGEIPAGLFLSPSLAFLSLQHNSIIGNFPPSLPNSSSLAHLDLGDNRMEGRLPERIDRFMNLSFFSVKGNKFAGEIPPSLGNVSGLIYLDLSENNLTGEIPASFDRLTSLEFLNVSDNALSGSVPILLARKFNSSSFRGNVDLCGYSAAAPCPSPPSPRPRTPTPPHSTGGRRNLSTKDVILIVAGVALALLLLLCCILLFCLMKKRESTSVITGDERERAARGEKPATVEVEAGGEAGGKLVHFDGPMSFTADDLLCATAEIMGKSTYGTVYRATLEDGSQVAVKRLREKLAKGQKEFESEANVLGRIRHRNLLALRSYYLGPKGEKLLVLDYMQKGSLSAFLHARGPELVIDWPTRMKIAMGVARGLSHLHTELNMVHGHLTSSNVLLDEDADAKISDYGLSRLMTAAANSSVVAAAGALGYRAPELSKLKKASAKTDVYSLGVIMLELLTGKSPADSMNGMDLPQWVASIVKEEWTNEVFDLEIMRDAAGMAGDELLNTLKLALHCVDSSPATRPEVRQVLQQLEEIKPELAIIAGEGASSSGAAVEEEETSESVPH